MFITEKKLRKMLGKLLGIEPKSVQELIKEIRSLVGPKEEIPKLKRELKELELQKTMDERDIRHLVKLQQEKHEVEFAKKEVELQKQFQAKEMVLQTKYHTDIVAKIEEFAKEQRTTYSEIMKRLPNVNMSIKQQNKVD